MDSDYVDAYGYVSNGTRYVDCEVGFYRIMPGSYTAKEISVSRYATDSVEMKII